MRGFVARVEESNHIFDQFWLVCSTKLKADYDFREDPALGYGFEIAPTEPPNAELPKSQGNPLYFGYGTVRA